MPSQDALLTDMRHASGWYAMLPEPAPANRLKGKLVADWVVVGAGVTGLAAARRLAELEPHSHIILLDEYRVGYGASGRNSGLIIDTPHLTEELDVSSNRCMSRLLIAGLAELEGHVTKHSIECEWSPRGHLSAIVDGKRAKKELQNTCRMLDAVGEEYQCLDRDALADVVGTRHYHSAVYTPRSVLVNPAALCRGLADTLPDNVDVYEESPVRRVEPGSPVRIDCVEGSIVAAKVLLTTNAFIPKLGFLRREVFPLIECVSLSRELTEEEQAAMSGAPDWGVAAYVTMRRTLSNRILIRHGTYYSGEFRLSQDMRRRLEVSHRKGLSKRYPMLDKLDFEYVWAGVFCMTRNWASYFGRLERGIFAALGYAGVGLPRGTISGKLLAEFASGHGSDLMSDVQAISGPKRLPPEPFLGLGVAARLSWHRWRSRAEW
ncbi:MAG: FAD-dependent oxidoreductase [Gammaproteobacteria bacterium]|nr:FAD-dependent oxidoreductase [Gammaproteobacteria bacterium]